MGAVRAVATVGAVRAVAGEEHTAVVRVGHQHVCLLQKPVHVDLGGLTRLLSLEEVKRLLGQTGQRRQAFQILLRHV
jgi:hypothetical protein